MTMLAIGCAHPFPVVAYGEPREHPLDCRPVLRNQLPGAGILGIRVQADEGQAIAPVLIVAVEIRALDEVCPPEREAGEWLDRLKPGWLAQCGGNYNGGVLKQPRAVFGAEIAEGLEALVPTLKERVDSGG